MPARPGIALTPSQQLRIVESLEAGTTLAVAGEAGMSSERSMMRYMQRGRAADTALTEALNTLEPETQQHLETLEGDQLTDALVALLPDAEQSYWRFWRACTRARAMAEERAVSVIREAGLGYETTTTTVVEEDRILKGEIVRLTKRTVVTQHVRDWRAEAWWLEKARRSDWGPMPAQVEVSGPDGGPVRVVEGLEEARAVTLTAIEEARARRDARLAAETAAAASVSDG